MRVLICSLVILTVSACSSVPKGPFPDLSEDRKVYRDAPSRVSHLLPSTDINHSAIAILETSPEALAERITLIREAEHFIDIQYFTWNQDISGLWVYAELYAAARRGVKVRLLLDDLLEFQDFNLVAYANHPNISVRIFNPFSSRDGGWAARFPVAIIEKDRVNHRMHNKLLLVDGRVAVMGGRNLGDTYFGLHPETNFYDLDVVTVGPHLVQLHDIFMDFWLSEWAVPIDMIMKHQTMNLSLNDWGIRALNDAQVAPELSLSQALTSQRYVRSPDFFSAEISIISDAPNKITTKDSPIPSAIQQLAEQQDIKQLFISSPYFLPAEDEFEVLDTLRERDVKITVLTNSYGSNDSSLVAAYFAPYRHSLLDSGVELYEYAHDAYHPDFFYNVDTHFHSKAYIVDQRYSTVGSINLDPRSYFINTEIGLTVDSVEFAASLEEFLSKDLDTNYWHLSLDSDKITWSRTIDGNRVTTSEEPETSLWTEVISALSRLLNLEKEL